MKKLKNKIFLIIFFILTFFLFSILFIFNYQEYKVERGNIVNNLMRVQNFREDRVLPLNQNDTGIIEGLNRKNEQAKIFMDMVVYTVLLDDEQNIIEVINHTPNTITDDTIQDIAKDIISRGFEKREIGNLYFEKYSCSLKNNNVLVIIDNTNIRERLLSRLENSIILFIVSDLLFLYVALKLTNWSVKPAIEAFENQKQFIADASHELKTPIAVIMANAEALENEPNERKWLNNIKSESERMSGLVSNLLDMARLENVNDKELYKKENLSKLVEMSILTFESLIYEHNIKLDYQIEENISFTCDGSQIKQLVAILIDNAIEHSYKEDGEIIVTLKKEKSSIILEIKNKGNEIPKEQREKIFERFYRLDESRNRTSNRYGLGLAIAKNIVLNHKGKIIVDCVDGYTIFKIMLKNNGD